MMTSMPPVSNQFMAMPTQGNQAPNPVSPETISQYVNANGITGHGQAAAMTVQAFQNKQFPLAQLFGKIASNPAFAKALASTDGDASNISWQDLGKLANGKPFIARQDVGLLPQLNEEFMYEMSTLSRLQPDPAMQQQQQGTGTFPAQNGSVGLPMANTGMPQQAPVMQQPATPPAMPMAPQAPVMQQPTTLPTMPMAPQAPPSVPSTTTMNFYNFYGSAPGAAMPTQTQDTSWQQQPQPQQTQMPTSTPGLGF